MKVSKYVLLSMLLLVAGKLQAAELTPYETRYDVLRGGSHYGEAVRKLTREGDSYSLYTETEISLLFLSDRRRFWSEFKFDGQQIQSTSFAYKRTGTGRNRGFSGLFDHQQDSITNTATGAVIAAKPSEFAMDEAASIEQLRFDLMAGTQELLTYAVLDEKGEGDQLTFKRGATETLSLPYGEVTAVKIERVRENSTRETDYWFAPELDYVLVKMAQRKDGDEVATLELSQIH